MSTPTTSEHSERSKYVNSTDQNVNRSKTVPTMEKSKIRQKLTRQTKSTIPRNIAEQLKTVEIKKPFKQQNLKKPIIVEDDDTENMFLDEAVVDQQLKALEESKEDPHDLLIKFRQRYPKSQAFAPEDEMNINKEDRQLPERILEFELEKCYKTKEDLISKRLSKLTKTGASASFSSILKNEQDNIMTQREKRDKAIEEISKAPQLRFLPNLPELYKKQVQLAAEKKNTLEYTTNYILQLYKEKKNVVKLRKHKLLDRWSRFINSSEKIERSEEILLNKIQQLDTEYERICQRMEELAPAKHRHKNKNYVTEKDFQYFIRSMLYEAATKKQINRYMKVLKWLSFKHRFEFYKRALDYNRKLQPPPPITLHIPTIDQQLTQLRKLYNMEEADDLQEAVYEVGQEFAEMFVIQRDSLEWLPYPQNKTSEKPANHSKSSSLFEENTEVPEQGPNPESVYLKTADWLDNRFYKPECGIEQEKQDIVLKEIIETDPELGEELSFLNSKDLSYATKLLKEKASTHFQRALKNRENSEMGSPKIIVHKDSEDTEPDYKNLVQDANTTMKLIAIYMLRYIKTRDCKRRILDILNYFRSIERKLCNDAQFESDEFKLGDTYVVDDQNLLVRDGNGHYVMYDAAVNDLKEMDDEILRIGTHYITKQRSREEGNIEIDKSMILEDIYEHQLRFYEAKKKVIDCFLEAYEHCYDTKLHFKLGQVIIDLIYRKAKLDLDGAYFKESFEIETSTFDLLSTFISRINSFLINSEKEYLDYLYKNTNESYIPGYPARLNESKRYKISVFPGSHVIDCFDFYTSLGYICYLPELIEKNVNDIYNTFQFPNPTVISIIRLHVIEKAFIEWKLLMDTDSFQKRIVMRLSNSRRSLENSPFMSNADALFELVTQAASENLQSRKFSSNETDTEESEKKRIPPDVLKEYEVKSDTYHTYANALELTVLYYNLIDQLFETDVLEELYRLQGRTIGLTNLRTLLEPIKFEEESTPTLIIKAGTDDMLSNIAITEFFKEAENINIGDASGLKYHLTETGLDEFRKTFQFQLVQQMTFEVLCRLNQIPLDDYFARNHSLPLQPQLVSPRVRPFMKRRMEDASKQVNRLKEVFFSVNMVKDIVREQIVSEYHLTSDHLLLNKQADSAKLREKKFQLAGDYCKGLVNNLGSYLIRLQIIELVANIKYILSMVPNPEETEQTFIIGKENHRVHLTSKMIDKKYNRKATCLLSKGGQVMYPWYLPHFFQVMKMTFSEGDSEMARSLTYDTLLVEYHIIHYLYCILLILFSNCKMVVPSVTAITRKSYGLEQVNQDLYKIHNELEHLEDPYDAQAVKKYLERKCQILYLKNILTLHSLYQKFVSENNPSYKIVQETLKMLVKDHPPLDTPNGAYWPRFDLLPTFEYNEAELNSRNFVIIDHIFKYYLLQLSEADRNYFCAAAMGVELLMEDLLTEEQIYSTSMPDIATKQQLKFLQISVSREQLKSVYFEYISKSIQDPAEKTLPKLEHLYSLNILKKARQLYEKELKEFAKMQEAEKKRKEAESDTFDVLVSTKVRKEKEIEFREKQVQVLKLELSLLLLKDTIRAVKEECYQMKREQKREFLRENREKLDIFNEFITNLLGRAMKSRDKDDKAIIRFTDKQLESAIETLTTRLMNWRDSRINEFKTNHGTILDHCRRSIFVLEQRLKHCKHLRELEKQAFIHRVQAEVTDKNYDLVWQVDSFIQENKIFEKKINKLLDAEKKKVREEYDDLVAKLTNELIAVSEKFKNYRENTYKEMNDKFSVVKQVALVRMDKGGDPTKKPKPIVSVKKEQSNRLQRELDQLRERHLKLVYLHRWQYIVQKEKYEKKIKALLGQTESESTQYYGNKTEIEERANLLRQELQDTQNKLSSTELEAEQLRKELQLQMRNKQKLINWKVKNAQLMQNMQEKVEKYERWKQYDVDKLLVELENLKVQAEKLSEVEAELNRKTIEEEAHTAQRIAELKRRLKKEQAEKAKLYRRLEAIREDLKFEGEGFFWQKKYFDAMAELQTALKEIDVLKTHTTKVGLQLPELVEKRDSKATPDSKMPDISEKKEGVTSKISRTSFGSFSMPRTQSLRSVSSMGRPSTSSLLSRPLSQQYIRRQVTPTMYRPLSYKS